MTYYSTYTPQQAHDDITELFDAYYDAKKAGSTIPPNKRIESADAIVEKYVETNGERPPASVLSRLATYLLLDTLTDSHPDKMSREEYPIMSYGQTGRHFERNLPMYDLQFEKDDVRGYVKGIDHNGDIVRNAILDGDTDEQKAMHWRLFLREILSEREAFIIEQSYGEGATQSEIAEMLDVSRQRVGVIMSRALDKIRITTKEVGRN